MLVLGGIDDSSPSLNLFFDEQMRSQTNGQYIAIGEVKLKGCPLYKGSTNLSSEISKKTENN